jgi:Amt family ammonium transporter
MPGKAAVPILLGAAFFVVQREEQGVSPTELKVAIDTVWVVIAGCMVFFMQAGFAMLEVGFSRGKNVGAVVAKILVNLAIGTVAFWVVGFAIAFGSGNGFAGLDGFFLHGSDFASLAYSDVPVSAKFLFEVVFCTVSLAIVWGTMLDRTKFAVYVVFAIVFAAFIYPLVGHWIWGGGFLAVLGMQDFAGSTVVHLCGAMAALAGTLFLGPRLGKFDRSGKAHPIPGHSMPLAVLGVLILWFGWFGFNPGSTLGAVGARFADIAVTTNLAAAAGVLGALAVGLAVGKTVDVGFLGNGAIAGLVAITAPCAYVEDWAAIVIGLVAGGLMVLTVIAVDRIRVDDPIGAIAGHGMGGIWGTLSTGLFTTPALAKLNAVGGPGLFYGGGAHQLGIQALGIGVVAAFVFGTSSLVFAACKATIGLRVSAQQELEGLDLHEHGMWGYPEQFLPGYGASQPYITVPRRTPGAGAMRPATVEGD